MTEISGPANQENLPVPATSNVPIVDGSLSPRDLDGLWRLSEILAESAIVPKDCVKRPQNVFGKLALGMELGLSFTQSLSNVAVIEGKPSIFGDAGMALIHASNQLESFEEYFEGEFGHDNYRAICKMGRKGGLKFENEFSVQDAKAAGKWMAKTSQGNDSVWMKYPKRMLKWRARWLTMRDGFSDILNGMSIYEELKDSIDMEETEPSKWEQKDPSLKESHEEPHVEPHPAEDGVNAQDDSGKDEEPLEPHVERHVEPIVERHPIPADTPESRFMELVPAGKEQAMQDFVNKAAGMNGCPVEDIYKDAMADPAAFVSVFETWYSKQPQYATPPETTEQSDPAPGPSTEEAPEQPTVNTEAMTDSEAMANMVAQLYQEYGQKTSAEPVFCRYIDRMVAESGVTRPQAYERMQADSDKFWQGFESYTLVDNPDDPVPVVEDEGQADVPETPDVPEQENEPEQETDVTLQLPENFYRKWFSMNKGDFEGYVWSNVKLFELCKSEKADWYLKAKGKWQRFYGDKAFPPETGLAEKKEDMATSAGNLGNLDQAIENLWKDYPDIAEKAQEKLKCVKIPPSPEGKQALLDMAQKVYNGEV